MTMMEIVKSLAFWGPGCVIAGIIIYAVYSLASKIGVAFVKAQQDLAAATAQQAQSMEGLRQSLTEYIRKDNTEHQEMLVLLKYLAQHHEALVAVAREHNNRHRNGSDDEIDC